MLAIPWQRTDTLPSYVENLIDPMVILDEAYQLDGWIFLIIVRIFRIYLFS
jgi:hypothetical protein